MSAGALERRAVVARNFPAAWVAPASLGTLPQKISSLLQRIGTLEGPPVVSQGADGLEALARFKTAEAAHDAVQTLHGTDMRTAAERRSSNFEAPRESERFWLRTAAEAGVAVPPLPAAAAPGAAAGVALAAAPPLAAATAPGTKRIKPNGVHLSPLPPSWAETDVKLLASPYGTVQLVRIEVLPNGQKGAYIDYQKDAAASMAKGGLDGLSLMGARMRCVMQEEPEPPRPIRNVVLYLDELPMASRPEVEPRLDDRELFLTDLPRASRTEESAASWAAGFGDVEEVVLLRDPALRPSGKAYARFRSHAEALKALRALRAAAADGARQAHWSESERALRGARGAYGLSVLRRIAGEGGARLREIRQATGLAGLILRTTEDPALADTKASPSAAGQRVHFVMQAEKAAQADECRALLSAELAKVHEAYVREVRGSLVLRGFPASWSEKGLKFVFAPFGGLSSVALEEEPPASPTDEAVSSVRLAYVKLRNEAAIEKAVANLHQTKVGDGDLVEECVVACHRWHQCGWSDGTFHVPIYIDQLAMSRRPLEAGPGPEDCELFVQNLPLQDMNRQQLQEYFEGFGEVRDLRLLTGIFSAEPTGEGYVRFKHHRDAQRCIEALTPNSPHEAEPTDLAGSWSESERALQRKSNSYRFNLLAELIGSDGSGIERLKSEAKLKGLWVLAESLQQKDRGAPPASGRQLHFVGRVQDEAHVRGFRELLERALEETHTKITDRIEKRRRKAEVATAAGAPEPTAKADAGAAAPALGSGPPAGGQPSGEAAWQGGASPGAWQAPQYWGSWQPPPGAGPGPFEGYPRFPPQGQMPPGYGGAPGQPGPWTRPPAVAAPSGKATVFEQAQASPRDQEDGSQARDHRRRSRSRRRRRRSGEGGEKDKKHSGSHHERRRRRDRSGNADDAGEAAHGDR